TCTACCVAAPVLPRRSSSLLMGLLLLLAGCGGGRAVIYRSDWVDVEMRYGALPINKALSLDNQTGDYFMADNAPTVDQAAQSAMAQCIQKAHGKQSRCMLIYKNGQTVGDVTQFFQLRPSDIGN
ncbi:MAG TPA: hypothetical protein PLD10_12465, partial [Rhodopila sp.]|nr:hypothetical protein [Rhodopila sp.]